MYRTYRAVRRFAGRIETNVEDDDSEGDST